MFDVKKFRFLTLLMLLAVIGGVAYAQDQPATPPTNPQMAPNANQPANFSDTDLRKFAAVVPKVQQQQQDGQQKMVGVIEDNGMKLDRFNEIQTAKMQNKKVDVDENEDKKLTKIEGELEEMQPKLQEEIEHTVTSSGLTVDQFQDIASAVQNDQDLQTKVQGMVNEQMQEQAGEEEK